MLNIEQRLQELLSNKELIAMTNEDLDNGDIDLSIIGGFVDEVTEDYLRVGEQK